MKPPFLLTLTLALAVLALLAPSAHAGELSSDAAYGEKGPDVTTLYRPKGAWLSVTAQSIAADGVGPAPWTEIVVTVRADAGHEGRARLELWTPSSRAERVERLVDQREVELRSTEATVHFPVDAWQDHHVRLLDAHGKLLWEASLHANGTHAEQLFVMGVETPSLRHAQHEYAAPTVARLHAMPRSAWTYNRAVLFLLKASILAEMDEEACTALVSWVRTGGALVLVHTNDDGAAPHDEEKLAGCGLGPFDHPSAVPQPGVFLGSGIVINARADMLSSSSKELERLEALLEEPRRQNRPTTSELAFVAPVDHALRAASAGLLAFALAVAGPVIFWRLRRRGAARVFPALALTSIAGFAGMLVLGRVLRPTAGTTTVVFHETTSGETSAYTVRTRAFASPSGPVRTRRAVPGSLLGTDIHGGRGTFRLEPDGTIVLNERQPPATDHVYLVESTLERLPGPITIACSSESCSIDNATGAPLDHAQLYVPTRGVFDLGTIDVHKSVSLAFPDASSLRESLEHRYLARSGVTASLVARRRGDEAEASIVGVACVTGCEALR